MDDQVNVLLSCGIFSFDIDANECEKMSHPTGENKDAFNTGNGTFTGNISLNDPLPG